jgi:hypothetical protein
MAMVQLVGEGFWYPPLPRGITSSNVQAAADTLLMDLDEEEVQMIGRVVLDSGPGTSKTFGTSGSKIGWLPGPTLTFATGATLRVGVKKQSLINTTTATVAQATLGAPAFDVWRDLVGGTDTLTATTWREETMNAGTPYTVAHGDLLAVCLHLNVTSGTPNVKVRASTTTSTQVLPVMALVTGGTSAAQQLLPNVILSFDDGTLGWLPTSYVFSVIDADAATIGQNNISGNIFRVPFACEVDSLAAWVTASANTRDFALELYATPLGTPNLLASVACDANILSAVSAGFLATPLPAALTLTPGIDYLVGVKQVTAGVVSLKQREVTNAAYFKTAGMGAECYAANSTAGATFVAQGSGNRRYLAWAQISALSDNAGAALLRSRVVRRPALRFAQKV